MLLESKGWKMAGKGLGQDFSYNDSKPYLWINTESERIGFVSESEVQSWSEDDEEAVEEILALKPGEMYDSDGGINLYICIK